MLKLIRVAITGCIASGKSTVCQFFKELGAYVVDADEIVHRLLSPDTAVGQKVIALIGSDIVVNHQIDRSKIAKKVFNQPSLLHSLEALLHPEVMMEIEKQYKYAEEAHSKLFVAEIQLLFEANLEQYFDYVITVDADNDTCKERFKARGKRHNDAEYTQRAARLLGPKEKIKGADFVIYNNGSLSDMRDNVLKVYKKIEENNSRCG